MKPGIRETWLDLLPMLKGLGISLAIIIAALVLWHDYAMGTEDVTQWVYCWVNPGGGISCVRYPM